MKTWGINQMDVRIEHLKEIIKTWTKVDKKQKMKQQERTRKKSQEHFQRKASFIRQRKAAKYVF